MLIIICMCSSFCVKPVNWKALIQRAGDLIKHMMPWKRNGSDLESQDLPLFSK